MIHFTCDCCKRILAQDDLRYVVKMEVYAAFDPPALAEDDDGDHLLEIQEVLQRAEAAGNDQIGSDVYEQFRFDLCTDCRKKFAKNPLGREAAKHLHFSQN